MSTTLKIRRDTAANWASADPILAAGEIGLETDTGKIKIGDGATAWTSLGYGPLIPVAALDGAPTASHVLFNRVAAGRFVQYGTATTGTEGETGAPILYFSSVSVTFDAEFGAAPLVWTTVNGNTNAWATARNVSPTGCTLYAMAHLSGVANTPIAWLALGQ